MLHYQAIEIWTSEEERHQGQPVAGRPTDPGRLSTVRNNGGAHGLQNASVRIHSVPTPVAPIHFHSCRTGA